MTSKIRHSAKVLFTTAVCLLVIAPSVSFAQADRETWQPPEKIMDAIGVKPGMRVGEAGAGTGYLTFPLARRVGPDGLVFANDISTSSLDVIRNRAAEEELGNIKIVPGEIADPLFPEEDLDMIIMLYVLHMLEKPVEFLQKVRKYLAPGSPLVIIEKNTTTERAHYPSFMTNREILETMEESGFELVRTETFLPKDTIYIYEAQN